MPDFEMILNYPGGSCIHKDHYKWKKGAEEREAREMAASGLYPIMLAVQVNDWAVSQST